MSKKIGEMVICQNHARIVWQIIFVTFLTILYLLIFYNTLAVSAFSKVHSCKMSHYIFQLLQTKFFIHNFAKAESHSVVQAKTSLPE